MKTKRYFNHKMIRLLLLAVLMSVQTLSFAHQVTHLSAGETELCDTCRVQSNTPVLAGIQPDIFPIGLVACHLTQRVNRVYTVRKLANFHSRAPPHFL